MIFDVVLKFLTKPLFEGWPADYFVSVAKNPKWIKYAKKAPACICGFWMVHISYNMYSMETRLAPFVLDNYAGNVARQVLFWCNFSVSAV